MNKSWSTACLLFFIFIIAVVSQTIVTDTIPSYVMMVLMIMIFLFFGAFVYQAGVQENKSNIHCLGNTIYNLERELNIEQKRSAKLREGIIKLQYAIIPVIEEADLNELMKAEMICVECESKKNEPCSSSCWIDQLLKETE